MEERGALPLTPDPRTFQRKNRLLSPHSNGKGKFSKGTFAPLPGLSPGNRKGGVSPLFNSFLLLAGGVGGGRERPDKE